MYAGRVVESRAARTRSSRRPPPVHAGLLASTPSLTGAHRSRCAPSRAAADLSSSSGLPVSAALPARDRALRGGVSGARSSRAPWRCARCQHRVRCHNPRPLNAPPEASALTARVRDLAVHFPVRGAAALAHARVVRAVDGVDLDVRRRETLGLVGEAAAASRPPAAPSSSSCGSTPARALRRASSSRRYAASFSGREPGAPSCARARRMQMIFQDPYASLNPRMTVGTRGRAAPHLRPRLGAALRRDGAGRCSRRSASTRSTCAATRTSSRAASASASASPARSRSSPS